MKDTVTPPPTRAARIVAALHSLDGSADAAVIECHALAITGAMLHLIAAQRARGFAIGHADGRAYAVPRSALAGPVRELRDLHRACRKAIAGKISAQDWTTAWAALPERTKVLIWKPLLLATPEGRSIDSNTLAMGFATEGFTMRAPKPEVVLPAIKAERARMKAMPNAQARTRDADVDAAIAAIRAAYRALTGHKGGRVIARGRLAGRLNELGREIDAMFGTALFAEKDSRRLR